MANETTPECFSIDEFCRAHRIGRSTYYRLRDDKRGPDECRFGDKVVITKEAAARWRAARDVEAAEAKAIAFDWRLFGHSSPRFDRG
jgi:hypothetical protein